MIKYILIRIVTFSFLLISSGLADDAVYYGDGASVFPIKSTDIQMVSETIHLKYAGTTYQPVWLVEVEEKFKNHGPAINVQIGFPFDTHEIFDFPDDYTGRTDDIKSEYDPQFKTYINGNPVEVVSKFGLKNPEIALHYKWIYTSDVHFDEQEEKVVRHTYVVRGEIVSTGEHTFKYILKTGALWKGNIESISIRLEMKEADASGFQSISPAEHKAIKEGEKIFLNWEYQNLKPDFNIIISSPPIVLKSVDEHIEYYYSKYNHLPDDEGYLRYMRNQVFAHYGYPFKNPFWNAHFYSTRYKEDLNYQQDENFKIENISEKHRAFIDRIKKQEKLLESGKKKDPQNPDHQIGKPGNIRTDPVDSMVGSESIADRQVQKSIYNRQDLVQKRIALFTGSTSAEKDTIRDSRNIAKKAVMNHKNSQQLKKDVSTLKEAIRLYPDPEYYFKLGSCLESLNEYNEALQAYDMSARLSYKEIYYSYYHAARMASVNKDREAGLKYFRMALSCNFYDLNLFRKDSDLSYIRTSPDFDKILAKRDAIIEGTLIGRWQDIPGMGSGWSQNYSFSASRSYKFEE
ncbi:MAG: YARHG domain-containing protein, partial [Calditrichia bacterium]